MERSTESLLTSVRLEHTALIPAMGELTFPAEAHWQSLPAQATRNCTASCDSRLVNAMLHHRGSHERADVFCDLVLAPNSPSTQAAAYVKAACLGWQGSTCS